MNIEIEENSMRGPRLITITKGNQAFYGFNLHSDQGVLGLFITAVIYGGPADNAGLCVGDRVVEVNGVNVEAAARHAHVVNKIKEDLEKTQLLVVDKVTDEYMKKRGIAITSDLAKREGNAVKVPVKLQEGKTEFNSSNAASRTVVGKNEGESETGVCYDFSSAMDGEEHESLLIPSRERRLRLGVIKKVLKWK